MNNHQASYLVGIRLIFVFLRIFLLELPWYISFKMIYVNLNKPFLTGQPQLTILFSDYQYEIALTV